jgi:hypothetical protein
LRKVKPLKIIGLLLASGRATWPFHGAHPKRASAGQLSTTVILKANGVFLIRIAADSLAKFAAGRT